MNEADLMRVVRCGFNEILAGYTPFVFNKQKLYIKHFSSRDQIEVDAVYSAEIERLKKRGIPTSEDKAKELAESNLWTETDDKFLTEKKQEIEGLKKGKSSLILKRQIDEQQRLVEEHEKEYYIKLIEKNELFGQTAELFANKKVSEYCIINGVFIDPECTKPFEVDEDILDEISLLYNDAVSKFDESTLKRTALSHLFQNYFMLAKSVYEFYGKAIATLTFYQVQLATYGDYYKSLLTQSENPPPPDVASDPDKLDEWINGSARARKLMENKIGDTGEGEGAVFTAIIGADKSDLDYLGLQNDDNALSLNKEVEKAGGFLSMADLMKLQGIH